MILNLNRITAIQDELIRYNDLMKNELISIEEYYVKVYPLEYELEYLSDIYNNGLFYGPF